MRKLAALLTAVAAVAADKLTDEDKLRLIRGLTAEFATAKVAVPRSKRPLDISQTGAWDVAKWTEAMKQSGQAAKPGDQVQITRVEVNDDNIVFEINGGLKDGRSWRDRIQVGMGTSTRTVPINGSGQMKMGTNVALRFDKPFDPNIEVSAIKKMLTTVFEFDKHSATESFVENLPPEIQQAIKDQKAIEGMDREQVTIAMGRPRYKSRETKDGVDYEDWVFGVAPGKITFVTFEGKKVVKVKETYAGLGGDVSARP